MTQDFFLGQLRLMTVAIIAYATGRGWLSRDDSGLIMSMLAPIGLLAGPWVWSIYRNINSKLVPHDSIAIAGGTALAVSAVSKDGSIPVGATITQLASTAKVVGSLLAALLLFGIADNAHAQTRPLTGNIARDFAPPRAPDLLKALDDKVLPDLQYALKIATASGSKVTAPCYQAWIDIITARQTAVADMTEPSPHIITEFEKSVELANALRPDSDFMLKCSPVASMVKKDIASFIGLVLGGGIGLATLVPGL